MDANWVKAGEALRSFAARRFERASTAESLRFIDAKIAGHARARLLAARRVGHVSVDLSDVAASVSMGASQLFDALTTQFPAATIAVEATPWVALLWREHLAESHRPGPRTQSADSLAVRVRSDLGGHAPASRGGDFASADEIVVYAPSDTDDWSEALWAAGLAPRDGQRRALCISRGARRRARRWLRDHELAGGPLVVVTHGGETPAQEQVLRLTLRALERNMKATPIGPLGASGGEWHALPPLDDSIHLAAVVAHAAVAVGAESDLAHLACALGVPVVALSPHLAIDHVASAVSACERAAAARWPWDRIERALP